MLKRMKMTVAVLLAVCFLISVTGVALCDPTPNVGQHGTTPVGTSPNNGQYSENPYANAIFNAFDQYIYDITAQRNNGQGQHIHDILDTWARYRQSAG